MLNKKRIVQKVESTKQETKQTSREDKQKASVILMTDERDDFLTDKAQRLDEDRL